MATEIERKFLVDTVRWSPSSQGTLLVQGYLARVDGLTVRVRCSAEKAWLTVKGPAAGISRAEFEYEVPLADGQALLELCPTGSTVRKRRHDILVGDTAYVVDVFDGANAGLVLAEVELPRADAPFERPDWLGEEVSEDPRYRNSELARNPVREWTD